MCQGAVASCPSSSFLAIYLCQLHTDTRPQLGLICLNQNSSPSRPESDHLFPRALVNTSFKLILSVLPPAITPPWPPLELLSGYPPSRPIPASRP